MNWRAMIVDDEPPARRRMRRLLEAHDVEVVAEARDVDQAREMLAVHEVDVIFLDVRMPGEHGFALMRPAIEAHVVFVTAYDEYAVRAFEVRALDYLLKPVDPQRLAETLTRLGQRSAGEAELAMGDVVSVKHHGGHRFIRIEDIVCIVAQDDYSEIWVRDGRSELANTTMSTWMRRLPSGEFMRVHRSAIVRLAQLEGLVRRGTSWQVTLRDREEPVPVSRTRAAELRDRFAL